MYYVTLDLRWANFTGHVGMYALRAHINHAMNHVLFRQPSFIEYAGRLCPGQLLT